jgi:hypothetical protein
MSELSATPVAGLLQVPFVVSWPDNTFLAEFAGKVTVGDVEAVNYAFSGDARMDTVRYSIWDFSRATAIDMPEQEVVYAAAFDKGVTAVRRTLKGALIASDGEIRRNLLHYLAAAHDLEVGWDTRLFTDLQSALHWLEGPA